MALGHSAEDRINRQSPVVTLTSVGPASGTFELICMAKEKVTTEDYLIGIESNNVRQIPAAISLVFILRYLFRLLRNSGQLKITPVV